MGQLHRTRKRHIFLNHSLNNAQAIACILKNPEVPLHPDIFTKSTKLCRFLLLESLPNLSSSIYPEGQSNEQTLKV